MAVPFDISPTTDTDMPLAGSVPDSTRADGQPSDTVRGFLAQRTVGDPPVSTWTVVATLAIGAGVAIYAVGRILVGWVRFELGI